MGFLCLVLVLLFSTLCTSSFASIFMEKRDLVALLYLSSWCLVTVSVLWLFFKVLWVGLVAPVSVNATVSVNVDNNGRYRSRYCKHDRVYTKRR